MAARLILRFLGLFSAYRELQARADAAATEVSRLEEELTVMQGLKAEAEHRTAIWQDRVDQADRETSWLRNLVEESRRSENYAKESLVNLTVQPVSGMVPFPDAAKLPQGLAEPQPTGPAGPSFVSPVTARAAAKKNFLKKSAEKLRMS